MNTQRYKQFLKPLCLLKETPVCVSRSVLSCLFRPHELQPTRLLCPWGFSKQEYWSELPCPSPGNLPNTGIEPMSLALKVDSLPSEPPGKPNE